MVFNLSQNKEEKRHELVSGHDGPQRIQDINTH